MNKDNISILKAKNQTRGLALYRSGAPRSTKTIRRNRYISRHIGSRNSFFLTWKDEHGKYNAVMILLSRVISGSSKSPYFPYIFPIFCPVKDVTIRNKRIYENLLIPIFLDILRLSIKINNKNQVKQ